MSFRLPIESCYAKSVDGSRPQHWNPAWLTPLALIAFAGNSLLCRAALGAHLIDPLAFTSARLFSGAITLALLARVRPGKLLHAGSWPSAAALGAYAVAFSLAYVGLGAGVGSLILFGSVQAAMIGSEVASGERPPAVEWLGGALALGGLLGLTLPGAHAPPVWSALLMAASGASWAVYTLRGRNGENPIAHNAGNFIRCAPLALVLALPPLLRAPPAAAGLFLAVASGAITSGIGYSIWYAALKGLTGTRAAIVQLAVPVLASIGGIALLGESVTPRLLLAGSVILGGVLIAVLGRQKKIAKG